MTHTKPNRLIQETSPYLLQHAMNPVDWYPWGPEALEKAQSENKPIFLSIGYSACHWCHVMEHESFENPETANLLNTHFVSIKVDREERPDLDSLYMTAVQMMTGRGGWPMSVFLFPDGHPFYGGTYFPPADRHGLPSFNRVLYSVAAAWKDRQAELRASAVALTRSLEDVLSGALPEGSFSDEDWAGAIRQELNRLDPVHGGFGGAPKFPPAMLLQFMLRYDHAHPDEQVQKAIRLTLDKMAAGGIYDHLSGGFSRYSVDAEWHVPHFEKMAYDNGLLLRVYSEAAIRFQDNGYHQVARETTLWILKDLTHPDGPFYSSFDADSEGEEGKFYTWTQAEIDLALPPEDAVLFRSVYDVTEHGNWEHTNVLRLTRPLAFHAARAGLSPEALIEKLSNLREVLLNHRKQRIPPARDEKILTAWNALLIHGLVHAGFHLQVPGAMQASQRAGQWLWDQMYDQNKAVLYRSWKDGKRKIPGFADDYGHLILAFTDLAMYSGDQRWADRARELMTVALKAFLKEDQTGFWMGASGEETLIIRHQDGYDNAEPAGNSSLTWGLVVLDRLFVIPEWGDLARKILRHQHQRIVQSLSAAGWQACAAWMAFHPGQEVVLSGTIGDSWKSLIRKRFEPQTLWLWGDWDPTHPLFRDRVADRSTVTAWRCSGMQCDLPVTDPANLEQQLNAGPVRKPS
ncbi:MAG: thioredoxin domain-containing protein [Bacteroidetes bacterium]|nr:thioredoxin domain-containing protein [Bacteroidota bacterium]